jgi:hypothetical protein
MPQASPVAIAILARAPVAGRCKTRLIPVIGAHAAAVLQERLTEHAAMTACAAEVGPVTLWGAGDIGHALFRDLAARHHIALRPQGDGDLGARMLAAMAANSGPTLVIGSDCPALTPDHLRKAAGALRDGAEVVLIPAEDGGYVLIGARQARPELFEGMMWSTAAVLADTRERIAALGFEHVELPPLWDVDTADDLARLEREMPELAL